MLLVPVCACGQPSAPRHAESAARVASRPFQPELEQYFRECSRSLLMLHISDKYRHPSGQKGGKLRVQPAATETSSIRRVPKVKKFDLTAT